MKPLKVWSLTSGAIGVIAVLTPAAGAADVNETSTTRLEGTTTKSQPITAGRAELLDGAIPAERATGEAKKRIDEFLEREARSARPVDIKELQYLEVQLDKDISAGAVVYDGDVLEEVVVVPGEPSDAPEAGQNHFMGAQLVPVGESATSQVNALGFNGATSSNAIKKGSSCRDLWFNATATANDHHIYDCWEKWKANSDVSKWAYNRYTLFDPANGDSFLERVEIVDATIRSRPWRDLGWKIVSGPTNYAPTPSGSCGSATFSVGLGPASISVPAMSCNAAISVLPNGSARSYGVDWNGRTQAQVYLDAAWHFTTPTNIDPDNQSPMYADYVWMETQHCYDPVACYGGNPSQYMTWTDSGW